MAPRIANLSDWSGYVLARLRREIEATRDPELESLYAELAAYPGIATEYDPANSPNPNEIMLLHELRLDDTELALFCTFTTFGTARDLTLPSSRSLPSIPRPRRPPKLSPRPSA
jgi:hypothetical protein